MAKLPTEDDKVAKDGGEDNPSGFKGHQKQTHKRVICYIYCGMDEGREINLNGWRRVILNIQTERRQEKEKVSVFSRVYKVFQNLRD